LSYASTNASSVFSTDGRLKYQPQKL